LTQEKEARRRTELAQDWGNRSKTAKVVFKIRSYFQDPWDYLRAPIARLLPAKRLIAST
jgi:hypothetical protein